MPTHTHTHLHTHTQTDTRHKNVPQNAGNKIKDLKCWKSTALF